jgi:hypothetical protein
MGNAHLVDCKEGKGVVVEPHDHEEGMMVPLS